jgi:hypothetical protein
VIYRFSPVEELGREEKKDDRIDPRRRLDRPALLSRP